MNTEELKSGKKSDIYDDIRRQILSDPENGISIVDQFKDTERYQDDFVYRLSVDSAYIIALGVRGRHREIISTAPDVIERASALKETRLEAVNWNNLGAAFGAMQKLERALECFCHVINTEIEGVSVEFSSVAYYNIALLFYDVDGFDKAISYIDKAIHALDQLRDGTQIYEIRHVLYQATRLQMLCKLGEIGKARQAYKQLKRLPKEHVVKEAKFAVSVAELYYCFYVENGHGAKKIFDEISAMMDKRDIVRQFIVIQSFVDLCEKFGYDIGYYKDVLLRIEDMPEIPSCFLHVKLYKAIRRYYEYIGDQDKYRSVTEKYIHYLEQLNHGSTEQQRSSLETIEMLMFGEHRDEISTRNVELKLLASEAIKTKNRLQEAYNKLEKISSMDGLTDISSRREFESRFLDILVRAKKTHQNVAVFMADIDNFKLYNDTFGHLEGDEVLKSVATVFRLALEEIHGISARFGGEEFIGACIGLDETECFEVGEKIRKGIRDIGIDHPKSPFGCVTVSVGIAWAGTAGVTRRSEIMRLADETLYMAKDSGKDTVKIQMLE